MRKWTYLVAALLMSGSATTFTSCIDNEEPAGIEAMRTAKAEFYSAQARYKDAETAYKTAQAAGEAAKAKQQEQLARQMELANDLLEAQNEADKEKIALELEKTKAEYLVKMKEQETALKQAEEEYLIALKELNMTTAKINSEYTAMLNSIIARITANRAERGLKSAELTQAQLDLNKFATNSLDTATVRGGYLRNIAIHEKNIERYTAELEILETLSGANSETLAAEATKIEKEIRTQVEVFNKTVDEYSKLKTEYTNKKDELTALENKLGAGYTEQMKEDATLTVAVGSNIQNEFIKDILTAVYKPNSSDEIVDINSLDDSKIKTENLTPYETSSAVVNYYTLIGDFVLTAGEGDLAASINPNENNNTSLFLNGSIVSMRNEISNKIKALLGVNSSSNLQNFEKEYQEVMATLKDKEAYLKMVGDEYKAASEEYYKAGGLLEAYKTAKAAYMKDATKTYYKVVKDYYEAITGTTQSPLTPTDAQKTELANLLKAYAPLREALDGFVHKTGETKTYTTLTKDNVMTLYADVLGAENLVTDNEAPYAKALKASVELFGGSDIVVEQPDVVTEYKYKEANSSARYTSGMFDNYLKAYEAVQDIKKLDEYVALSDALEARSNELLAKVFEFKNTADAIAQNSEVIALDAEIKDLLAKLELNHVEILTVTFDEDNIAAAPGKLTVERVTQNGTGDDATYYLDNITFTQGSSTDATPAGYLGNHLVALKAYFNSLNTQNDNYAEELEDMKELLAYEQEQLAADNQLLAQFDNGGYVLTTQNAPSSITIGDKASYYTEVTINNAGSSDESKTIIYSQYNPNTGAFEIIYQETIEKDNPYYDKVGGSIEQNGGSYTFEPSTNYLKAIIEAYEAKAAILEAQIKDLDETYEILLKEKDKFMEVINGQYQ